MTPKIRFSGLIRLFKLNNKGNIWIHTQVLRSIRKNHWSLEWLSKLKIDIQSILRHFYYTTVQTLCKYEGLSRPENQFKCHKPAYIRSTFLRNWLHKKFRKYTHGYKALHALLLWLSTLIDKELWEGWGDIFQSWDFFGCKYDDFLEKLHG